MGRPGHIFPLKAKNGGVLRRTGHTEAAVDLARLAGFEPAGILVEILNEDGTMARLPQLKQVANKFDLKLHPRRNVDEFETAFTYSIDSKKGVSTYRLKTWWPTEWSMIRSLRKSTIFQ